MSRNVSIAYLIGLGLLLLAPMFIYPILVMKVLCFALFACAFNLLLGYTGLLSFGHAVFLGSAAYVTGHALKVWQLPTLLGLLAGTGAATLLGWVIGSLATRRQGIYFAMVTLALAQCVYFIFYKAEGLTGGENGLRGVKLEKFELLGFQLDFLNPTTKYYIVLVFVAMALWFVSRILSSPFGAVIETIRENEKRSAACGYDVARTKLLVFVLSSVICGLAGTLRALHLSVVPVDALHYLTSGQVVMMALLGGMGTFFGPFVGATTFLLIEDVFANITRYWQLVVGAVFITFVLFFPRGIWGSILHWLRPR